MTTTPRDPRAQLADAIARLTDDQVLALMQTIGVDMAVQGVFLEMQRRFLPERAGPREVVVQWDLATQDAVITYQMIAAASGLGWASGAAQPPELQVGCSITDFMRLMIGQLDTTEAFMTGRLRVSGDLQLVQELAAWFNLDAGPTA
ncbi:MAG TPA: SCP2 sterol-binding domain-containing protein [Acidimicrobiales bacterium]|nr:SCP2 sterol-binding domain-containing protein [Acidimicrobiales bacterium]